MWRYLVLILLALLVVLSYTLSPLVFRDIPTEKLWGGISSPAVRRVYILSILLSAIAFLLLVAYLCWAGEIDRWFVPIMGFLLFSALWMPFMFLSLRYSSWKTLQFLVILVLLTVAGFAGWMAFQSLGLRSQGAFAIVAIISAWYLFFHTLVLDGLVFPFKMISQT